MCLEVVDGLDCHSRSDSGSKRHRHRFEMGIEGKDFSLVRGFYR